MAQLKLILMSVFLTVLIWASADQLLTESAQVQVVIRPTTTADQSFTVSARHGAGQEFQVVVSGPKRRIDQLKQAEPLNIKLPIDTSTTGVIKLRVLEELQKNRSKFGELALTSVSPEYLEVLVDRRITVRLPVWVDKGNLDYTVEPGVEPQYVSVTISQQLFESIPVERRGVVLSAEKFLRNQRKGELLNIPVPLGQELNGVSVEIEPSMVNLTAMLSEQRISRTIPAVPVRFEGSVALLNEYRIELRDRDPNAPLTLPLTVKGPAETVARMVSGDIKITGTITLSRTDAMDPGQYRLQRPTFSLPHGVELVEPDSIESFEFRLIRHSAS